MLGRFTLKVKPVPFNATMPAKRLLSTVYPLYIYLKFLTHDDLTAYNSNHVTYQEYFMNSTRQVSYYIFAIVYTITEKLK